MIKHKKNQEDTQKTELETKVDAMMSIEDAAQSEQVTTAADKPGIDIFDGNPAPLEAPSDASVSTSGAPLLPHSHKTKPLETVDLQPLQSPQPASATQTTDDVTVTPLTLDSKESDEAIQDIIAKEADETLAAQDAGIQVANDEVANAVLDEPKSKGHPVIWFVVFVTCLVIVLLAFLLLSPDLAFAP